MAAEFKAPAQAQVIDASNTIIIPGFVDAHRHSWEGQLRRIIPNGAIARVHGHDASGLRALLPSARHVRRQPDHRARLHRCGHHLHHRQLAQLAFVRAFRRRDPGLVDSGIRAVHARARRRPANGTDNGRRTSPACKSRFFASDDQLVTLRMFSGSIVRTGRWPASSASGSRPSRPAVVRQCWSSSGTKNSLAPTTLTTTATAGRTTSGSRVRDSGGTVNVCPRSDPQYGCRRRDTGIPEGARSRRFGRRSASTTRRPMEPTCSRRCASHSTSSAPWPRIAAFNRRPETRPRWSACRRCWNARRSAAPPMPGC